MIVNKSLDCLFEKFHVRGGNVENEARIGHFLRLRNLLFILISITPSSSSSFSFFLVGISQIVSCSEDRFGSASLLDIFCLSIPTLGDESQDRIWRRIEDMKHTLSISVIPQIEPRDRRLLSSTWWLWWLFVVTPPLPAFFRATIGKKNNKKKYKK